MGGRANLIVASGIIIKYSLPVSTVARRPSFVLPIPQTLSPLKVLVCQADGSSTSVILGGLLHF